MDEEKEVKLFGQLVFWPETNLVILGFCLILASSPSECVRFVSCFFLSLFPGFCLYFSGQKNKNDGFIQKFLILMI